MASPKGSGHRTGKTNPFEWRNNPFFSLPPTMPWKSTRVLRVSLKPILKFSLLPPSTFNLSARVPLITSIAPFTFFTLQAALPKK